LQFNAVAQYYNNTKSSKKKVLLQQSNFEATGKLRTDLVVIESSSHPPLEKNIYGYN